MSPVVFWEKKKKRKRPRTPYKCMQGTSGKEGEKGGGEGTDSTLCWEFRQRLWGERGILTLPEQERVVNEGEKWLGGS